MTMMNAATIAKVCRLTAFWLSAWMAFGASAEVFYGGQTKGLPGDPVELTINARADTVLESIDIVPEYAGVAGLLNFVSLTGTSALMDDGLGQCTDQACAFLYVETKTFSANTVLATLRFTIAPGTPVGIVAFDPGVFVGDDILPATSFEVLAVPEPTTWAMFLLGLLVVGCAIRRKVGGTNQRRRTSP